MFRVVGGALVGLGTAAGHYSYLKYKRANNGNTTGTGTVTHKA
jgi:hypothetical protein